MHDSRGAALKVGDRVLIEGQITLLAESCDENFCCVDVTVVTPDQPKKELIMSPPSFSALSTRMLTKIGACVAILFMLPAIASAQSGSFESRLSAVESTIAAMNATVAATNDRLTAVETKLDMLAAKLDAGNRPAPAVVSSVSVPSSAWGGSSASMSSSSMMMSSGACSSGSCGSGGRMGLFGGRGLFGRR